MVFVKVRETYDLHTTKNKMTVIAIHTPNPDIIKRNFPGLLMQCRAYRPVLADVRVACASVLPLDPQGIGLDSGDVAPEDMFNPILYKAMTNFGMSQLEARINGMVHNGNTTWDVSGSTADVDSDEVTNQSDEFPIYYGLLSNMHGWKHAMPQSGLTMTDLRPLVYEMLYNVGDNAVGGGNFDGASYNSVSQALAATTGNPPGYIRGNAKPLPMINCSAYSATSDSSTSAQAGFPASGNYPANGEVIVPWLNVIVGAIIVPPSKLHELFYRMVVEWTIEFSSIRPISEITTFGGLVNIGNNTHFMNYSYTSTKEALTGDSSTILENDSCMVAANVDVTKVM